LPGGVGADIRPSNCKPDAMATRGRARLRGQTGCLLFVGHWGVALQKRRDCLRLNKKIKTIDLKNMKNCIKIDFKSMSNMVFEIEVMNE